MTTDKYCEYTQLPGLFLAFPKRLACIYCMRAPAKLWC